MNYYINSIYLYNKIAMRVIYFFIPCIYGFFSDIRTFLLNNMKKTEYKEWWYDPRIHNFGNIGLGGWIHSKIAPYATVFIDNNAYNGKDVRKCAAKKIKKKYPTAKSIIGFRMRNWNVYTSIVFIFSTC